MKRVCLSRAWVVLASCLLDGWWQSAACADQLMGTQCWFAWAVVNRILEQGGPVLKLLHEKQIPLLKDDSFRPPSHPWAWRQGTPLLLADFRFCHLL